MTRIGLNHQPGSSSAVSASDKYQITYVAADSPVFISSADFGDEKRIGLLFDTTGGEIVVVIDSALPVGHEIDISKIYTDENRLIIFDGASVEDVTVAEVFNQTQADATASSRGDVVPNDMTQNPSSDGGLHRTSAGHALFKKISSTTLYEVEPFDRGGSASGDDTEFDFAIANGTSSYALAELPNKAYRWTVDLTDGDGVIELPAGYFSAGKQAKVALTKRTVPNTLTVRVGDGTVEPIEGDNLGIRLSNLGSAVIGEDHNGDNSVLEQYQADGSVIVQGETVAFEGSESIAAGASYTVATRAQLGENTVYKASLYADNNVADDADEATIICEQVSGAVTLKRDHVDVGAMSWLVENIADGTYNVLQKAPKRLSLLRAVGTLGTGTGTFNLQVAGADASTGDDLSLSTTESEKIYNDVHVAKDARVDIVITGASGDIANLDIQLDVQDRLSGVIFRYDGANLVITNNNAGAELVSFRVRLDI